PDDMVDRIPDVNPTAFQVGLSTPLVYSGERVILKVTGQSADNGTVQFIDQYGYPVYELAVTHSMTFQLVGMTQTQPTADGLAGNANKLRLVAQAGLAQL